MARMTGDSRIVLARRLVAARAALAAIEAEIEQSGDAELIRQVVKLMAVESVTGGAPAPAPEVPSATASAPTSKKAKPKTKKKAKAKAGEDDEADLDLS